MDATQVYRRCLGGLLLLANSGQETLSRQSLLTHDRKRSLAYNEDEQYKSVVFNRAFPS